MVNCCISQAETTPTAAPRSSRNGKITHAAISDVPRYMIQIPAPKEDKIAPAKRAKNDAFNAAEYCLKISYIASESDDRRKQYKQTPANRPNKAKQNGAAD